MKVIYMVIDQQEDKFQLLDPENGRNFLAGIATHGGATTSHAVALSLDQIRELRDAAQEILDEYEIDDTVDERRE